jgi:hypothetical protein
MRLCCIVNGGLMFSMYMAEETFFPYHKVWKEKKTVAVLHSLRFAGG